MICEVAVSMQVSFGRLQVCHIFWKYLLLFLISGKGMYAFSSKCSRLVASSLPVFRYSALMTPVKFPKVLFCEVWVLVSV